MDKLSGLMNSALAARLILVGYEHAIFDHLMWPVTTVDLAIKVSCDERYLREWCQALYLSGYIECDKSVDPVKFSLSAAMGDALAQMKPMLNLIPVMTCDTITKAYVETMKSGAPIPNALYPNVGDTIGQIFTGFYRTHLGPILSDLDELKVITQQQTETLEIADIGCGQGESTQSLARVFVNANLIGIDIDGDALRVANSNNVNERVRFVEADFIAMETSERHFDIVCLFTCLHCMPFPTKALKRVKSMLLDNGIALVLHVNAARSFAQATADEATTVCLSSIYCLPQSRVTDETTEDWGNLRLDNLIVSASAAGLTVRQVDDERLGRMALYVLK